jgi:RNA polymerase sigma factor (sigma-70 family)
LFTNDELMMHLRGCALNQRGSQKRIYNAFYGYAMSICERYASATEDAEEIMNDAFLKVFKEIHQFKPAYTDSMASFKGWIRRIMIYTAIDHFRKEKKHALVGSLETAVIYMPVTGSDALDKLSCDEVVAMIKKLSPAYRTVLNLFVIDGFSHEEIAAQLDISVGTSKSNLSKARKQLQGILAHENKIMIGKNAG